MTTPQTTPLVPTTPPPVNPLDIPKKVAVGQLLEIVGDTDIAGTTFRAKKRLTDESLYLAIENVDERETTVTIIAECRHCPFTAEIDVDAEDQQTIEFRVWNHEHANPGHVIGYRTETVRWWES